MRYLEKRIRQVILRVYDHMEKTGRQDSFARFPYLETFVQSGNVRGTGSGAERRRSEHELFRQEERSEHEPPAEWEPSKEEARYEAFLYKLSGGKEDAVLKTAVDLALAATLMTEFAAYLNYYTGNRATLQLAFEICGELCPDYAEVRKNWERLRCAFCVEKKNPIGYANIEADHELIFYLAGDPAWNGVWEEETERFCHESSLHPMYIREELAGQGADLLGEGNVILHICGRGGKRFLVKHIAKRMGNDVLFVQADQICGDGEDEEYRRMRILRRAFLHDCMVCIRKEEQGASEQEHGASKQEETAEELLRAARAFLEAGITVILCTEDALEFSAANGKERIAEFSAANGKERIAELSAANDRDDIMARPSAAAGADRIELLRVRIVRIELTPLSREQRMRVWSGFAEQYGMEEDIEQCSVLYRLNAVEIARAVGEWESGRSGKVPVLHEDEGMDAGNGGDRPPDNCAASLTDICCRILCAEETQKLGTVIRPSVELSNLIVSGQMKRRLEEICCGALQRYRIYEEWGLARQYPYGRSVSLLLAGPPGTGKTMTAHGLAHEIGMPLYQVDLSHIMDKYIGETEKHLEQVFDFAAKTNMVLFFDEADALFAKRGEVTEGKDRYANMEVSYLLQKMEQFDGVVILATNFYQHIDKAFLRRIKYVLKYQEPDAAMRKRMWESVLTPSLPREEIDTDYLAEQFAFSGGVIKNVIQNACICAVYEKRPLRMEHVLRSVRMEYEKMERNMTPGFWGEYGYLMEQEQGQGCP
ncbi:MAG: AAA family ATPase [Clostridium sp.]|nr:AAA family ATPase [Clostridium sp.]